MTQAKQTGEVKTGDRPFYLSCFYKGKIKPANIDNFPKSAKLHVNELSKIKIKSVLDIGCGAGGIMLALQEKGIEQLYGIEASESAIEMATERFKKFGNIDQVDLQIGNAVDMDIPKTDGVSLHRVVCCYPNVEDLLGKSVENKPLRIVLTFPRKNFLSKFVLFVENFVLSLVGLFKPSIRGLRNYLHSPEYINELLERENYDVTLRSKSLVWHTWVFDLHED